MLNQVETIFDDMLVMMKKLKKDTYEKNMKTFRETYGHFFDEMIQYADASEDKEAAARETAVVFTEAVNRKFAVKGKIRPRTQADLNFFMIYYVFPAILLTAGENSDLIAKSIRDEWKTKFKDSNINYTDYDTIYGGFRNKIFGIF